MVLAKRVRFGRIRVAEGTGGGGAVRARPGFQGVRHLPAAAVRAGGGASGVAPPVAATGTAFGAGAVVPGFDRAKPVELVPLHGRQLFAGCAVLALLAAQLGAPAVDLGVARRGGPLSLRRCAVAARSPGGARLDGNRSGALQLPDLFHADSEPAGLPCKRGTGVSGGAGTGKVRGTADRRRAVRPHRSEEHGVFVDQEARPIRGARGAHRSVDRSEERRGGKEG